jgi:hypothetical protein
VRDHYTIKLPINSNLGETSPTLVTPSSPLGWRRPVETLAYFFKREFRYDFPQFEAAEQPQSLGYVPYEAWLFHEPAWDRFRNEDKRPPRRSIGAACFRWRDDWKDHDPCWTLDWVWFHPYERRLGRLTRAWPSFEEKYGQFPLETPISHEMEGFLRKIGRDPRPGF